jgi:hypothetical protein
MAGTRDRRGQPKDYASERLEGRGRIMAAFTDRPGEPLNSDQLAQVTGVPAYLAREVAERLHLDGSIRVVRDRSHVPTWVWTDTPPGDEQPLGQQQQPRVGAGAPFFCRACHRSEVTPDTLPPTGWLRLQERSRDAKRAWFTKGLYCTPECLATDVEAGR